MMKAQVYGLITALLLVKVASSNVLQTFGAGSRASSMAGAYSSISNDPNSQYYNPASMAFGVRSFSYSTIDTRDRLKAPGEIAIEGGGSQTYGEIDYANSFGNAVAFSFPMSSRLTIGLAGYVPFSNLLNFSGEDAFAPQYVMYLSRNERPVFNVNAAWRVLGGLSLGVGCFISQNISGATGLYIVPNEGQKPSYATLNMRIKSAPYASIGVLVRVFEILGFSGTQFLDVGISYKQEAKYKARFSANTNLKIMSTTNLEFNAILSSIPYYDPEIIGVGISAGERERYIFSLDLSIERYSGFKSQFISLEGNFENILPAVDFRDRVVLRSGAEYRYDLRPLPIFLRAGFAWVPTPVPDQTGDGNLLDCDKYIYSVGAGTVIQGNTFFIHSPLSLDFHYQYHFLKDRMIVKNDPGSIGYHDGGYVVGGSIHAVGLSVGLNF